VNPDTALTCDCGYSLKVEASAANPVWPLERILRLRGTGVTALILGLACLFLVLSPLRRAASGAAKQIEYSSKFAAAAPALLGYGILLTFFTRRAAKALDRRAGIKPIVWLGGIVLVLISVAFMLFVEHKFREYGYRRPHVEPIRVEPPPPPF
jgi:hypothetical protein